MTRNHASAKAAGRSWERAICDYLIASGWPYAERRRLSGSTDRGDVAGLPGVVIEAKNTSGYDPAGALDEATRERDNDGAAIGVAWIKRKRHGSPSKGLVVMDGQTFVQLLKEAGYQ